MVRHVHEKQVYMKQLMDAIRTIEEFTIWYTHETFVQDKKTMHACLMVLVHIWEIVASMQRYHIEPWLTQYQKIIDMRNFLAHQYIDIRPTLIAKTIFEDIPILEREVKKFLDQ